MTEDNKKRTKIAYFSMEIAIKNSIKSFSGGLGVLAGDTLKAAADSKIPMVGITLLNDQGYFKQIINEAGEQIEEIDKYDCSELKEKETVSIYIGDDKVKVRSWEYKIKGQSNHVVPVYFLDTDLEENKEEYRSLTGQLYGGDNKYRLMQEVILGRAGVKLLPSLGYENIKKYHLNEGHAGLATVELLSQYKPKPVFLDTQKTKKIIEEIREKCVFTTHTPVKAGHDVFNMNLVKELQPDFPEDLPNLISNNQLNMSHLAAYFSSYINGVSRKHKEVSEEILPNYDIASVTNGVHSQTWTSSEFKTLFDKHIPNWRSCSLSLRNAFNIPLEEIWKTHQKSKERLINYIKKNNNKELSKDIFTIGFARRFASYKRPTLLFKNIEKLLEIHENVGRLQIVYAGKAHPHDQAGKDMIKEINNIIKEYQDKIDIVFLENYDMEVAKTLIPGVDIWLNTPLPPKEGSGTSGMKAAHNGVPHFSTLDGWWLEGFIYKKTGWSIGKINDDNLNPEELVKRDAQDLYEKLEKKILPRYYNTPKKWKETMRNTIAINASFFNSERMIRQYAQEAYL
ncbi:MAG: alpha-glucan family phosphorylase [Patescibacteria group bacterium]